MAGFGSKVGPYFRGFRPLDSLGYVVVVLIGAGSFLTTQGNIAAQQLLQAFLIAEALLGSIFILNNRFDYVVDGEAGPERASKNPISIGLIGLRESESLGLALMILGFLAVVLWLRNVIPILLYSITWILGVLYSAPPFRLKSRAGWDILSHAAVVLGLFIMGSSFANYLTLNVLVYAIPFLMLSTVYELRNHLKDWVVDSSAGLRTSISAVGLEKGRQLLWISTLLFWASILLLGSLLGTGMMVLVIGTMVSYTLFLLAMRSRYELIFDLHLWIMGGVYSAFKLLVLARLL